jgi:hypothetical protein
MGFLYRWQTIIDIIVLLLLIFIFRSNVLLRISVAAQADILCRSFTLLRRSVLHFSSWISVYITFDRFIKIHHPSKLLFMQNKKKVSLFICVMFLVITILNLPNFFFYQEVLTTMRIQNITFLENNMTVINRTRLISSSTMRCTANLEINLASDIISISLRTYLPFILMLIFDIIVIKDLFVSKAKLSISNQKKEIKFSLAVIFITVSIFIFNGALSVAFLMVYTNSITSSNVWYTFTVTFSFYLQTFSFFINFFLNSLFRNEFLLMIKLRKLPDHTNGTTQQNLATKIS